MHPLLERQIRRYLGNPDAIGTDMQPLVEAIDSAYRANDDDRALMERSLDLMSNELVSRNDELSRQVEEREKAMVALKQSEEALIESMAKLQDMDEARLRFINAAAHELGTPLTPLMLQLEVFKKRLVNHPDDQQQRSVEILERNVDRLNHLVKDLFDSSKLQTGNLKINDEDIDLGAIVSGAYASFKPLAQELDIDLAINDDLPFLPVHCDPNRMGQVLDNFLSNALKFTNAGGQVAITVQQDEDKAIVTVQDDGLGIAKENLHRLFMPFSQVHEGAQTVEAGTGLGLYICKGLIEQSQGTIWAESDGVGKGSLFGFTLPLQDKAEA